MTFSAWRRHGPGFYEGWGSLNRLPRPVDRARLLIDARTAHRFDAKGIKAFQGSPIRLDADCSAAIGELLGGLLPSVMPLDEPYGDEETILWAGLDGLGPEATIEAAVANDGRCGPSSGFGSPPHGSGGSAPPAGST